MEAQRGPEIHRQRQRDIADVFAFAAVVAVGVAVVADAAAVFVAVCSASCKLAGGPSVYMVCVALCATSLSSLP